MTTIAFPAISCGVYGYPPRDAARIAIGETLSFLSANASITRVVFACFGEKVLTAFQDALREQAGQA
jgi:O-acetyl-ADP-ribose deacetylase (regulator of RNase III)